MSEEPLTEAPEDEGDDQEAKVGTEMAPTNVAEADIEDAPDQEEDNDAESD